MEKIELNTTMPNDWTPFTNKSGALSVGLNNIIEWTFTTPFTTTTDKETE